MVRALVFFTFLGFAIWGTLILTDLPGLVSLEWRGYRIDTTVAFLLGAVVLTSFTSALVYRFWLFLRRTPGIWPAPGRPSAVNAGIRR